jgi:hypothetical protein
VSQETTNRTFDELASGLASGSISRGKALKLMGGLLVGGTLGSLGIGGVATAARKCKPAGKHCKSATQCCSGNCSSSRTCAAAPCIDVPTEQPCCRPCCCTCVYIDAAGNDVSSCLGGYPDDTQACFDACDAATPQGSTASSHNFTCPSVPSTFSCVPAVTGSGTVCSGGTPCTSSAG